MKKTVILIWVFLSACSGPKRAASDNMDGIPACIARQITIFKTKPVQYPPHKIYQYKYNNKIVYYIPAICCDQFSDLYDNNCVLLGHPDGGFSGKGDLLFLDFLSTKTEEKLIWEDERGQ